MKRSNTQSCGKHYLHHLKVTETLVNSQKAEKCRTVK